MVISCNIATHKARRGVLPKCLSSLFGQSVPFDVIRVYCNDYRDRALEDEFPDVEFYYGEDLTDRAKFYWLQEKEIYFTCDDDILYPPDYVERSLKALEKYPSSLITYHGRKLKGKGLDYYHGHKVYHFMRELEEDALVDVCGSGVSVWDTSKFMPDVLQYSDDCMSDLLVSLEAAKKGVNIVCAKHFMWDFRTLDKTGGIYVAEHKNCGRQGELADEIYDIQSSAS